MTANSPSDLNAVLASLQSLARDGVDGRSLPPVESWNPPFCGDANIEIRADGTWWHEGTRMTRESLVRLFSTILRKDEDGFTYLVTPGEKVLVSVDDAPFLGTRVDRINPGPDQVIAVTTNLADVVTLGPDRPLRVRTDPDTQEPRPYALVRGRLEARILRAPFYELVEWAEERAGADGPELVIRSNGAEFSLGRLDAYVG